MTSARFSILASLFVLLFAAPAAAQSDVARAEDLFLQGKRLLADKHYDEACPKFAESARLDPSSGVELALGICYEGQGKTASAWGAFTTATALARRDARHDREAAAAERAKALEPLLSRVSFTVAPEAAALAGLELRQDGVVVGSVSWGESPVDPGVHSVEVKAPGHVTFTTTFTVTGNASRVAVPVPALALAPAAAIVVPVAATAASPAPASQSTAMKTAGFVVGGAGAASIVAASVLGVLAIEKASDVHHDCGGATCSDATAVSENQTAGHFADASTGLFIAGGALAAAGVLMIVLAPGHTVESPPQPATATLHPLVGPTYLGLGGTF